MMTLHFYCQPLVIGTLALPLEDGTWSDRITKANDQGKQLVVVELPIGASMYTETQVIDDTLFNALL